MSEVMIVGVDGSEPGMRAAEFAANVASAHNAKLLIVYIIEWSPYTFNTPEENEQRHNRREREIEAANSSVLQPLVEKLSGCGASVEGLVLHGHPAKMLNSSCAGQWCFADLHWSYRRFRNIANFCLAALPATWCKLPRYL